MGEANSSLRGIPTADAVRGQLQRIVTSPVFARSARLKHFLTEVVEIVLAGQSAQIKEYWVGAMVFGRGDTFDPKADNIVRMEGTRLRHKLREYYEIHGGTDPVRIDLPPGSYVPVFGWRAVPENAQELRSAEGARRPRSYRPWMVAAGAVLAAGLLWTLASRHSHVNAKQKEPAGDASISPEARDLYLEGRFLWQTRRPNQMRSAIEMFRKAAALSPNYAKAYVGIADAYGMFAANGGMNKDDAVRFGREAASRALALNPSSPEAHSAMGVLEYSSWRWTAAESQYRDALHLNPNLPRAWYRLGATEEMLGNFPEAEKDVRRAMTLDSAYIGFVAGLLELYYDWRRFDDGIAVARQMLAAGRPAAELHCRLARLYDGEGDTVHAMAEWRLAADADEANLGHRANLAIDEGHAAEALRLGRQIEAEAEKGSVDMTIPAILYARLGRNDDAIRDMERAWQAREPDVLTIRWQACFDGLRPDPRFQALLAQVGRVAGAR
ncbi:hypothetical protein [Bradyrhizobium sp.]|uniref:tetratricopeptide repeat protein n=1 Tax=Bradyrhizobium sp. TaxID=376 RepID=UPI00260D951B|nr:hypothetical protein [Bradyrhizobium sp.]